VVRRTVIARCLGHDVSLPADPSREVPRRRPAPCRDRRAPSGRQIDSYACTGFKVMATFKLPICRDWD
jgi:hypothetical protein